ncbi:MAG: TfoX/Sxy family protein [Rhodomicrobium sp.]
MSRAIEHDKQLFDALLVVARAIDPAVRGGYMFGCPAIFHGRKMAACVYGDQIALKVPAALADATLASGRAVPFAPYGRAVMREWIMAGPAIDALDTIRDLIAAAIAYAEANNDTASG